MCKYVELRIPCACVRDRVEGASLKLRNAALEVHVGRGEWGGIGRGRVQIQVGFPLLLIDFWRLSCRRGEALGCVL